MRLIAGFIIILVILLAIIGPQAFFVVDETQIGIVTQFGKALRAKTTPGLAFKTPFIQKIVYLDDRLLLFDAPPERLLTQDKMGLVIDVYARGRIDDPILFFEKLVTVAQGKQRAVDIIASELRREIGLDEQSEIIKTNREEITNKVMEAISPQLHAFGIEVKDVRIKRADFPVEIATRVHARMMSERKRKADKERAEGTKRDLEVRADVDKQATIIQSAAQRDADIIRGCGEAEAIKIFADALEQDPEFYTFQRSLEIYVASLSENTMMIGQSEDLGKMFEVIRQGIVESARTPSSLDDGASEQAEIESRCGQLDAESAARLLLAAELDITRHALVLTRSVMVDWPDTSLECPKEGETYDKVITPGYRFIFDHELTSYNVHTNIDGLLAITCLAADEE